MKRVFFFLQTSKNLLKIRISLFLDFMSTSQMIKFYINNSTAFRIYLLKKKNLLKKNERRRRECPRVTTCLIHPQTWMHNKLKCKFSVECHLNNQLKRDLEASFPIRFENCFDKRHKPVHIKYAKDFQTIIQVNQFVI